LIWQAAPAWQEAIEMAADELLTGLFDGEVGPLMVITHIVLGNNAVTNQFIERRFGMPVHAWSALYAVGKFPGIRAKEIRMLLPRPQNTISRAVSLLETRGLLVQEPSSSDGREKRLFVTEEGKRLLVELVDVSRRRQEEWLAPLSPEERTTFVALARKVAEGPDLHRSAVMAL
jgi:DNA-binding MarR family transcriptional regulator